MKKSDLSAHVASQVSLTKSTAESAVNAVFDAIGDALAREETVSIAGFGTFTTKRRPSRMGRNPRTGEKITIAASKVASFKAGKALRDTVN